MHDVVLLIGDSHLAKVDARRAVALQTLIGSGVLVVNAAMGGTNSADLDRQLEALLALPARAVVVSVGTNDLAPWKRVELEQFRSLLERSLSRLVALAPTVVLGPPPVIDAGPGHGGRSNSLVRRYARASRECCQLTGARFIDTGAVLGRDSPADGIHAPDGVHLSDSSYDRLLVALAETITETWHQPRRSAPTR